MENCDADNTKNGEESIPLEAIKLINKIIETTKNLLIKRKKRELEMKRIPNKQHIQHV